MPEERSLRYVARTLRLTVEEHEVLNGAAEALNVERSALFQEGVIDGAHRLGLFAGDPDPARRPAQGIWRDSPQRRDESTAYRISVSYTFTTDALLERASAFVGVSPTRFAVGATLRYASKLKQGGHPGLRHLQLPPQYR